MFSCRQQADPLRAQPIRRLLGFDYGARFDTPCQAFYSCQRYCRRTILSHSFHLGCCARTIAGWLCLSLLSRSLVLMSSPFGIRASTRIWPIAGCVLGLRKPPKRLDRRGQCSVCRCQRCLPFVGVSAVFRLTCLCAS